MGSVALVRLLSKVRLRTINISPYEEDEDMDALIMIYRTEKDECGAYDKFTMYQFQSGIVAIETLPRVQLK